jgi:hypothetical protein
MGMASFDKCTGTDDDKGMEDEFSDSVRLSKSSQLVQGVGVWKLRILEDEEGDSELV